MSKPAKKQYPSITLPNGKVHDLALFRILDRDAQGRPKGLELIYDENIVHIEGGEEFMTGFLPREMVKKAD
jgi:hypothetical protein